ncbi:MAG TPA: NADH-quinone oxidoreductase subunit NuoH, partial [Blastocatellia bacterium]|nr:NADH-quinone oxidoreductase subunit NuoH [Blastocatellia bacterium]
VAYLTFLERKIMSWIQLRIGPNRVGPWGLLQPLADGVKMIFKEDIIPTEANKWLYVAAPAISLIPALMTFIVIPYGSTVRIPFTDRYVALHVTNMNIGLLYIFALTSLGVYGLVLAGWASNNKYSLLGGLRSSAQMISYELAFGISIVSVLLYTGTLDLTEIVGKQSGRFGVAGWNFWKPPLFLVFVVYYIASLAECNRTPFDLPEAESELVAGYHTEYSSMKFVMFQMAEYINLITASSIAVTLFFGGYIGPKVDVYPWLGLVYFVVKVLALIVLAMWIRFTLPRFRYDQLMRFGWKFLLPAAIVNVIITATVVLIWPPYHP